MIERLQQKRKSEGGFTLVELLVVIVILGILAAIVVFAVGGITDKGDSSSKSADKSVLETAEEAYFAKQSPTGVYTTEANLVTNKFLRTPSTKHDICVSNGSSGAPALNTAYVVIDQNTALADDADYDMTSTQATAAGVTAAHYDCAADRELN
jgi:general secretion pathway protein G